MDGAKKKMERSSRDSSFFDPFTSSSPTLERAHSYPVWDVFRAAKKDEELVKKSKKERSRSSVHRLLALLLCSFTSKIPRPSTFAHPRWEGTEVLRIYGKNEEG